MTSSRRCARRTADRAILLLAVAAAWGCAPVEQGSRMPGDLPVLALSAEPSLEIGVMEGDEHYTFQDVVDVLPLPSGELAISDGGASELTLYAPDGTFLRRFGGRGQGPGEFRGLSRIYPWSGDSVLALDNMTQRVSVFDSAGGFARQMPARSLSGDSVFAMDVWLYGRFWVDGAVDASARTRVKRALDRLPPPTTAPGYREVRVASDGRLWIREPASGAEGLRTWTVAGADGRPQALIDIPRSFDPRYLGAKRLVGRWLGDDDVNFVRAYAVEETGRRRATPGWLSAAPPDAGPTPATDEKEIRAQIAAGLKTLASAQEIHYASHSSYTADIDSLGWERPEGMMVDFVNADRRGWVAVFTHPGFDRICGLGYGFTVPPGWPPGAIICGPAATPGSASPAG
jgi:hypothetical protein